MITFSKLGDPLYGRLGNQMFQIAATIGISKDNKHSYIFPVWAYSEYFENRLPQGQLRNVKEYHQKDLNYYDIVLSADQNWDLHGFFQSERFFKNVIDEVRYHFEPSAKIETYIKAKYGNELCSRTCSVHVRRGDYVKLSYNFPVQPLDYYLAAMCKISAEVQFLIFSDDIAWCKKNFKGDNVSFIEGESDIIDMFLMSYCDDHIISNSSFSWWGAWLNKSDTKKIICPEFWFGPAVAFNTKNFSKDIFASNFQKLILPPKGIIAKYGIFFNPLIFVYFKIYTTVFNFLQPTGSFVKRKIRLIFYKTV